MGARALISLVQLCRETLDADPFSGCVFVFRSAAQLPSDCWPMTARGSGSPRSGFRKDVFGGGQRQRRGGSLEPIKHSCCWLLAIRYEGRADVASSELNDSRKKVCVP